MNAPVFVRRDFRIFFHFRSKVSSPVYSFLLYYSDDVVIDFFMKVRFLNQTHNDVRIRNRCLH